MSAESLRWLGATFWLKDHGLEWIVREHPQLVVPVAEKLAEAGGDHA